MPIIINNISDDQSPVGVQDYELLINKKLICTFNHDRSHDGLAQCLRDAADAVEALGPRQGEWLSLGQVEAFMDALKKK